MEDTTMADIKTSKTATPKSPAKAPVIEPAKTGGRQISELLAVGPRLCARASDDTIWVIDPVQSVWTRLPALPQT
jgi:hypothetical protein